MKAPSLLPLSDSGKPFSEVIRDHVKIYYDGHENGLPIPGVYDRLLPLVEKPLIEVTLEAVGGNRLKAAKLLGINRNTLHKKITELGIDPVLYQKRKQP